MATNVFGTPITDETLKGMVEYHDKKITQIDRARVALEMKNAEGKDENARRRLEEMCKEYDDDPATMGLIYNATGYSVRLALENDWNGHLCKSPYPTIIANGQWGVFLHGKYFNSSDYSKGAIVYTAKNDQGVNKDWLVTWANNRKVADDYNRVYAEIRDVGYYNTAWRLDSVRDNILDKGVRKRLVHQAHEEGGLLITSMGNDKVAFLEAIMTLPQAVY